MTQANSDQPVITVKPSPDIYTVLLIVGILVIGVSVGLVLHNLLTPAQEGGYGLEFMALFDASKLPEAVRPPAN